MEQFVYLYLVEAFVVPVQQVIQVFYVIIQVVQLRERESMRSFISFKVLRPSTGCGTNNPCLNAGVCITTSIGYQCQCINNFGGSYCQINTGIRNRVRN